MVLYVQFNRVFEYLLTTAVRPTGNRPAQINTIDSTALQ